MPWAPKRPCTWPGCGELTDGGRCEKHKRQERKQIEDARGTAHQRGYTFRWSKYSKAYIRAHPLCAICQRAGIIKATECVDHIIPHKGDSELFWDPANHQAACKQCNDRKAVSEGRWG